MQTRCHSPRSIISESTTLTQPSIRGLGPVAPGDHHHWPVKSCGRLGSPAQSPLPLLVCERADAVTADVPLHDKKLKLNKMIHFGGESK